MIFCMWHISGPFLLPNWRDFATQLGKNIPLLGASIAPPILVWIFQDYALPFSYSVLILPFWALTGLQQDLDPLS